MQTLRERLDLDLARTAEAYRQLTPTDQDRLVNEAIAEVLEAEYAKILDAVRSRLGRLQPPPRKGDSWSW